MAALRMCRSQVFYIRGSSSMRSFRLYQIVKCYSAARLMVPGENITQASKALENLALTILMDNYTTTAFHYWLRWPSFQWMPILRARELFFSSKVVNHSVIYLLELRDVIHIMRLQGPPWQSRAQRDANTIKRALIWGETVSKCNGLVWNRQHVSWVRVVWHATPW